jgi:integrase
VVCSSRRKKEKEGKKWEKEIRRWMMTKPVKNKVKNGIVFTGKGWSYVLRVPDNKTGKTKPKWVGGFESERLAKIARDKARVAIANRDYATPGKLTVGEFLLSWIDNHEKRLKPTTAHKYRQLIRLYLIPQLGSVKITDLRPTHIENFYSYYTTNYGVSGQLLAPSTVAQCGAILKKALKYAVEVEGLMSFNPATRVPLPKGSGKSNNPWSMDELNTFLDVASEHRLYFFFRLSAFTGARRGELLALRWSDFDGKSIMISKSRLEVAGVAFEQLSTKGGSNGQRRVILDSETIDLFNSHRKRQLQERILIGEHWQDGDFVFTQENGLPLDPGTPSHLFGKVIKKAGLRNIRLHDLRHLHATELLRLGEPLHVVAQRLGHRDAMVTATIYAHVSNEQDETASQKFANATKRAI